MDQRNLLGALQLLISVGLYSELLRWVYLDKIAPVFDYLGLTVRADFSVEDYVLAILLVTVVGLFLPRTIRRPSEFVLWIFYIVVVVPSVTICHYADTLPQRDATVLSIVISLLSVMIAIGARLGPKIDISHRAVRASVVWGGVWAVSLLTYAYLATTVGLRIQLTSLDDVRDLRFAYRDYVDSSGALIGYLVRLQGNVLNPALIAKGIFGRRLFPLVAGCFGQVLLFPVTGFKLTLLSVPALLAMAWLFRRGKRNLLSPRLLHAAVLGSLAAIVVDAVQNRLYYVEFFIDRMLLTPGILTAAYVKVYSDQPKAIWGDSFLSGLVDYPYDRPTPFVVGSAFMGRPENSANANLFGDGFANLGIAGMVVESIVFILVLWMLDATGSRIPPAVFSMILLLPTFATANTGIFTSLLTNGYLAAAVLMFLLPSDGWGAQSSGNQASGTVVKPPDGID